MNDNLRTNIGNDRIPTKAYIAFAVITVLSIIPFLILHYYNQPTSEDFYYSGELFNLGFSKTFRTLYKFWGGRYFGYLLILTNPLCYYSLAGYKFVTFLMMLFYFGSLYLFVSRFTRNSLNLQERLLFTLSVIFIYMFSLPSIGQGFYWLISILFYNVGVILSIVFLVVYSNQQKTKESIKKFLYLIPCTLLLAAIIGSCEIVGGTMFIILTAIFVINLFKTRSVNYYTLIYSVLFLIGLLIVKSAPGNVLRSTQYPGNHDIYFSFINAVTFTSLQIFQWTFFTPILLITFLLIPIFKKLINDATLPEVFKINPIVTILLFTGLLYANSFLILWSIRDVPYGRILNFIFLVFIIGWFYNTIVLMNYYKDRINVLTSKIPNIAYGFVIVLILIFGSMDSNIKTAYSDLVSGKASEYDQQLNERYNYIHSNNSDTIYVKSIVNVPKSFFLHDIYEHPNTIYNEGYAKHFKKGTILLKK